VKTQPRTLTCECARPDWRLLLTAVIICAIAGQVTAAPGDWLEEVKLLPADGGDGDCFGCSVSLDGEIALIGASSGTNDNGEAAGSAYVFRDGGAGWFQEAKLLAADGEEDDEFGVAVSIHDDVVVIGATSDEDNGAFSGSAYVFRLDGSEWVQEAKLLASDGAMWDGFGGSVSISGNRVIIGAHGDDDNGDLSGSAYVFRHDSAGWVEETKLLPADGTMWSDFGFSVSVSGNTAIVGAPHDHNENSGAAYVFRYDGVGWVEEAKLLFPDGEEWGRFGCSVSIAGDIAVIGAQWDNDNGFASGSAYVFRYNGTDWVEEAKLLPTDGEGNEEFGCSVSISDNRAVIGASKDDDNGTGSGSAYVFRHDGTQWVEEAKLLASDGTTYDSFGRAVSISGDTAVLGADGDDFSGSSYVFERANCPADFDGDGDVDTADLLFLLGAWGTPDGDVDGDGDTDTADLLALLGAWGECP